MEEISNKTLATLLVVAIVISLAGTFFAMRGVSQVTNVISGAATSTSGTASVNISEQLSIKLVDPYLSVNFGPGFLNSSSIDCYLHTSQATKPDCWNVSGGWDWAVSNPSPFLLENDGNVYANVTYTSTTNNTALWSGYTQGQPNLTIALLETTGRLTGCASSAGFDNTTITVGDGTAKVLLCNNMTYENANDQFYLPIGFGVPTIGGGNYSTGLTFTAHTS